MVEAQRSSPMRLWEAYRSNRSQKARDELVVFYSPLVKYVAGRLGSGLPPHVERGDLVSSGIFGLIQAIERFDACRGFKFETFAIHRIRGSILDELRAIDWVPRSIRTLARCVEQAYSSLEAQLGRTPSDAEIAGELGMSEEELQKVFSQISYTSVIALDEVLPAFERSSRSLGSDNTGDLRLHPVLVAELKEARSMVRKAMGSLGEREKTVLVLYYYENLTLSEIGAVLGVTEGRISQIHTKAVLQLKAKLLRGEWSA